ncbi:MAG: polysaccharide biosynthesis/export family protein [Cyanobacteria bacterium P01_A01_bin.84]
MMLASKILSVIGLPFSTAILAMDILPVAAQNLQTLPPLIRKQTPAPDVFPKSQITTESFDLPSNNDTSPQFNRYILGTGDGLIISVEQPPGTYRLGTGDGISVLVQRFPDLGFQSLINPEGNITVPLLGTVPLKGLTLKEAQNRIRAGLNRYVVEPVVVLSLTARRPNLNFRAVIDLEGNVTVPQLGTISAKGLSIAELQEKIRLGLSRITVNPIVSISLERPRPVQITISGEIFRPGIYPVNPANPRVADALLTAGGSTNLANLRQVIVRRKLIDGSVVSQAVDLYSPLQNGGSLPSLRLQDGDTVIVPPREIGNDDDYDRTLVARSSLAVPQIRIRVLNYVSGGIVTQTLPNGSNFIDALSGVSTNNSNLREIALVRFDPERGKAVTQRLDAKKVLAGDISQNVPLQDNDVIVVGHTLIGKITNSLGNITRPFFDVQSFIRFFELFGGSNNSD